MAGLAGCPVVKGWLQTAGRGWYVAAGRRPSGAGGHTPDNWRRRWCLGWHVQGARRPKVESRGAPARPAGGLPVLFPLGCPPCWCVCWRVLDCVCCLVVVGVLTGGSHFKQPPGCPRPADAALGAMQPGASALRPPHSCAVEGQVAVAGGERSVSPPRPGCPGRRVSTLVSRRAPLPACAFAVGTRGLSSLLLGAVAGGAALCR